MRSFIVVMIAVVIAVLALRLAQAHDSWISRGGYHNSAGEWCCGEKDCFPVEDVSEVPGGYQARGFAPIYSPKPVDGRFYQILSPFNEFIPFGEVQPSPDGKFWRCALTNGTRRCFFAPPPGS